MLGSAVKGDSHHGKTTKQESHARFTNPVRRVSPLHDARPKAGEEANGAGHRWLLEPSDSCFASPQPAGSITELSAGCYQYRANPEQLYLDLDRCNKALRVLFDQNVALKNQLKAALAGQEDGDNIVKTPSDIKKEKMDQKRKVSQASYMPTTATASTRPGSAFHHLSGAEFYNQLMSLSRMADQETAVSAYRDVLLEVGKELALWEETMEMMRRDTMREKEEALLLEDQLEYELATFQVERMMMLTDLEVQAKEAENVIGELKMQLDSAERRMRCTKNKADARIAELTLVIASSHVDVERLQQENAILRNQLEIERQGRDET